MLRWSVLVAAVLVDLPVIWGGLVTQDVPIEQVVVRFLITVPVCALLLGGLRLASSRSDTSRPERRRPDPS